MTDIADRIFSYITSKFVDNNNRKIGVEEESIIYTSDNKRIPVNSSNPISATNLLKNLNEKIDGNGYYSLEPGGQIEWSSKPFLNLNDLASTINHHHGVLNEVLSKYNLKIVTYGVEPNYLPTDLELIKEQKYQIMDKNMEKNGTMGKWMMRNTASIQVNIDTINKNDLEEMVFVADCLHPVAAYLFSNSPYFANKKAGSKNMRNMIWEETDNSRCRNLFDHGINQSKDLLKNYIEFVLEVPSIFQLNRYGDIIESKSSIGDLLNHLYDTNSLSENDIKIALHQIFTNVRLKNVVEVRGADRTPRHFEMAPIAFWTGILTDLNIRDKILNVCSNWTKKDREIFNQSALYLNHEASGPEGKTYFDWIKWAGELSIMGLKNRKLQEEQFFESFYYDVINHGPYSIQQQKNETKFSA